MGVHRARLLLAQWPDLQVRSALARRPRLALVALVGLAGAASLLAIGVRPMLLWSPPLLVQRWARPALWALLLGPIAYLGALTTWLAQRTQHPERKKVAVLAALLFAGLEAGQVTMTWPMTSEVSRRQTRQGWAMETSYYTCAAAVAATIAHELGNKSPTEKSMCEEMGSSMSSTTAADFIDAMAAVDIRCTQREVLDEDLLQLHPPALVFIDQIEDGPEGHAAAVLGFKDGLAWIWDPRKGHYQVGNEAYSEFWHGRAIECVSAEPNADVAK